MTKERTYFTTVKLESGEWVNLVYVSTHRKGTLPHIYDFADVVYDKCIRVAEESLRLVYQYSEEYVYLLNDKNKDAECFDDYKTIDLR